MAGFVAALLAERDTPSRPEEAVRRCTPLAALTKLCIELPVPRRVGLYLLIDAGEVVYVGQSVDVDLRVGGHASSGGIAFDRAIFLPVALADLAAYEGALIRAFAPRHNRNAPVATPRELAILLELGLPVHDTRAARRRVASQRAPQRRGSP